MGNKSKNKPTNRSENKVNHQPFFANKKRNESFFEHGKNENTFFKSTENEHLSDTASSQKSEDKRGNLPDNLQVKMENSFKADFSDVEIHENSTEAKDLDALAFTQGNEVHFAPGKYSPESTEGQEILAHELSHIIQQREGKVKTTHEEQGHNISEQIELENEADRHSKIAASGGTISGNTNVNNKTQSRTAQKKSAPKQLFRSLPTGATILGINPDFANIYLACSNLAYSVENRVAGNVNWAQRIGQRLESSIASNTLTPLSIGFTETEGINFDWHVSISWRINNVREVGGGSTSQVTRGGGGSTTVSSGTSSSSTDSGKITGGVGGHEGAPSGGVEVGTSSTQGSSNSQGATLQGGVSRQGNERAQSYTAGLVAQITVSGSANFSGSDYINPFKWGTSLGSELTTNGPQSGAYVAGTIDYQDSRPG